MLRTERLAVVLTPAEKKAVVRMAEAEGGLSQAALLRRLIHHAARGRGIWPPEMRQCVHRPFREVKP